MIGGSAVFQGRIWILGGGTYDTPETPTRNFYNDPAYAQVVRDLKQRLWRLKREAGDEQGPLPPDAK